jgi:biotin transport system substrate-specific component
MLHATALNKETRLTQLLLKPVAISLILAISAQVNVLTVPVPITMQPLILLFIGLLCSPQTALLSVGYYLIEIAIGLPFASGFASGFVTLLSPRAGYFFGFLASVFVSAQILKYKHNFVMMWVAAIAGTLVLYTCGVAWLSILFGFERAVMVGLYPFLSEIPTFITIAVLVSYQGGRIFNKFLK